jgi:hypothetical protein
MADHNVHLQCAHLSTPWDEDRAVGRNMDDDKADCLAYAVGLAKRGERSATSRTW